MDHGHHHHDELHASMHHGDAMDDAGSGANNRFHPIVNAMVHGNGDGINDYGGERLSPWEEECASTIDSQQDDLDYAFDDERARINQKLWLSFQAAAQSIAQLYKGTDGRAGLSTWSPFQNAASGVTSLYKECIESQRRFANIGFNCGIHRRNKELVNWLKKRKRCIRREELLAFLSGKASANSSGHHHHHTSHSHLRAWNSSRQRVGIADNGPHAGAGGRSPFGGVTLTRLTLSDSPSRQANEEDLETFREALIGFPNSGNQSPNSRSRTCSNRGASGQSLAELNAFLSDELNRYEGPRKRSSSSADIIMDSPTSKRSKHF